MKNRIAALTVSLLATALSFLTPSTRAVNRPDTLEVLSGSWEMPDSVTVKYFTQGDGRKILMIHGGPGIPFTEPIWALHELTDKYQFVYYDQRGCGKSTRPIDRFQNPRAPSNFKALLQKCGIGVQIHDVERIREKLGEDKLFIMGFSYGALLASLYAKKYPDRVEAMILIAPANLLVFPPDDGGLYELVKPLLPDSMKAPYNHYLDRLFSFSTLFQQTDSSLQALNCEFAPYFSAALRKKRVSAPDDIECDLVGGWSVQGIYMSMGMSYDHRPALKTVTAPVLVLHGSSDIQSESASRTYSQTYPNATFVAIPDAGHFMWMDQPSLFTSTVRDFLTSLGSQQE
jgi:proline iminopeptidase